MHLPGGMGGEAPRNGGGAAGSVSIPSLRSAGPPIELKAGIVTEPSVHAAGNFKTEARMTPGALQMIPCHEGVGNTSAACEYSPGCQKISQNHYLATENQSQQSARKSAI
jgi:hypothetical protein